jgi:hypothetical protein
VILESRELDFAIAEVAVVIAVGEPSCEFSKVTLSDRLAAQSAERSWHWRPAIHHDEFHIPPPNEKQRKRHLTCTNAWTRQSFSAVWPAEASRLIVPSQTEEPSSMIEITELFGILDLNILIKASAAQTLEQLRVGRFGVMLWFRSSAILKSKCEIFRRQSEANTTPSWQTFCPHIPASML